MESNRRTLLIVATCRRPGVSYLHDTLAALLRNGALLCQRVLLVDGRLDGPAAGFEVFESAGGDGIRGVMWRAFRLATKWRYRFDQLLFCEDDIEVCRHAIEYICECTVPDDSAFIDFHNMNRFPQEVPVAGLYSCSTAGYHGNQCMLFPARTVEYLAGCDPQSVHADRLPNGADLALGALLATSPWPTYSIHFPCLVRHVGAVSAAHAGESLRSGRVPTHFPGRQFDARSLRS